MLLLAGSLPRNNAKLYSYIIPLLSSTKKIRYIFKIFKIMTFSTNTEAFLWAINHCVPVLTMLKIRNHRTFKTKCMAENCWNWTVHKPVYSFFFHSCHSVNEKILYKEHFCGYSLFKPMQKLHQHPRDSAMPAARWTTTVNKAIENFTINYFKRINTSQVFNCITKIFQNLS